MTAGESLRGFRLASGLTQAELAARVGVGAPYISRLEHGRDQSSPALLGRIADALGASDSQRLILFAAYGQLPPEVVTFLLANPSETLALVELSRKSGHQ